MIQDSILVQQRYRKFIETICKTQVIYGLRSDSGFATSVSNDFQDEETSEPAILICFWSELVLAKVLAKEEWASYKPEIIALNSFLENWCIGMYHDNTFAGINFDRNLFGYEVDTLEMALEIIKEIKEHTYTVQLLKFKDIDNLEYQIKQLLEGC